MIYSQFPVGVFDARGFPPARMHGELFIVTLREGKPPRSLFVFVRVTSLLSLRHHHTFQNLQVIGQFSRVLHYDTNPDFTCMSFIDTYHPRKENELRRPL